MKIGLIDVDSHNFPNLCLMKLSEYHTRRGDRVEWWSPKGRYDLVYKSRVFTDTYSKDTIVVNNAEKVVQGGTGYGPGGKDLPYEIEHIRPDYFLYPRFLGTAYGFLSRGCPRNCGFCIVSGKEGRRSVKVADLSEFWRGEDEIKLLDPNLLACPDHEALLEQLAASRALVDFTQGLDIRLTNPDNIALLNRVRTKAVHFAWDNPEEDLTEHFKRFVAHTAIRSDRNRRVYVLTNYGSTHEQDLYRVNTLRALGYDPYVMIYERPTAPKITRHPGRFFFAPRTRQMCLYYCLSLDLKHMATSRPKKMAAQTPAAPASKPPVNAPSTPFSATASCTPFASRLPKPVNGTVAPAPAHLANGP